MKNKKRMSLNYEEKKEILELARKSIAYYLEHKQYLKYNPRNDFLKKILACFVTLTIDSKLRGCIGHLLPSQELYKDIIENSVNAAFSDPRFKPLTKKELEKTRISVSILSMPKQIQYKNTEDILRQLDNHPGVIIEKGVRSATFLPQVWEELPEKELFLSQLCLKAGLDMDEWKTGKLKIKIYSVISVKE